MVRRRFQRRRTTDGRLRHRYQYVCPATGRRRSRTFPNLDERRAFERRLDQLREDISAGRVTRLAAERELYGLTHDALNVGELWARYFRGLTNANTRRVARSCWEKRLAPHFADCAWWELTPERMRDWDAELVRQGYADPSRKCAFELLAACMRLALESRRITELPWGSWRVRKTAESPERPCCNSLEELAALVAAAIRRDQAAWQKGKPAYISLWLLIMQLTGMRSAEAAGLAWDCVQLDSAMPLLTIRYQSARGWRSLPGTDHRPRLPTKGKRARTQVLHPDAAEAFRELRRLLKNHELYELEGPVFPRVANPHRGSFHDAHVFTPPVIKQLAKDAGFDNWQSWCVHSTRHGFASMETKAAGKDWRLAADRTGHKDLKTLFGYLHRGGGDIPQSGVAELPAGLVPRPAMLTAGEQTAPALPPAPRPDPGPAAKAEATAEPRRVGSLPNLVHATAARIRETEAERDRATAKRKRDSRRPFVELAREWLDAPGTGTRPPAVTMALKRAYRRAYSCAIREGKDHEAARRAGKFKQDRTAGAWASALKREASRRNGSRSS